MEKLLTAFLYEHKQCPLPGIGTLLLMPGEAKLQPAEQQIAAPIPYIELVGKEFSPYELIETLAAKKGLSHHEAAALLKDFCGHLLQLPTFGEAQLSTAGSFYMDENGRLHFKSSAMPAAFFPMVDARRVVRTDVAHNMLVGDTETNTTVMTERLQETAPVNSRWWIAAIVFTVISLAFIAAYFLQPHRGIGSDLKVDARNAPKTYSTP